MMLLEIEMPKTLTVRLDDDFHRRLMARLAAEGTKFQAKVQDMLEEYMNGPGADREEIARQVEIAREGMRRYAPALRELAR
jgi:plasmid stability protein